MALPNAVSKCADGTFSQRCSDDVSIHELPEELVTVLSLQQNHELTYIKLPVIIPLTRITCSAEEANQQ